MMRGGRSLYFADCGFSERLGNAANDLLEMKPQRKGQHTPNVPPEEHGFHRGQLDKEEQ